MSRVNIASDSKQYAGIYRLFWVVWTIMLLSAVLVAPFIRRLGKNLPVHGDASSRKRRSRSMRCD